MDARWLLQPPEAIGPDTSSLLRSQSITEESEAVEELIKPDQTG
jgi:hypothetical protein